jgi:hypothetical protein
MRRALTSAAVICIVIGSTQPAMPGKKPKEDIKARLHSLQTIYVDGSSVAVSYIRENLAHETCLDDTTDKDEADAVLEVWEESPVPCGSAIQPEGGVCTHLQAKLFDAKTNKLLWYREDQHFPALDLTHNLNGPYKWVLSNLNYSCCKGRT